MISPHDIKEKLLEVVGAFVPGIPKSRHQKELEHTVERQRARVEKRRKARAGALLYDVQTERPSAEHYAAWMNLSDTKRKKKKKSEGEAGDEGD